MMSLIEIQKLMCSLQFQLNKVTKNANPSKELSVKLAEAWRALDAVRVQALTEQYTRE